MTGFWTRVAIGLLPVTLLAAIGFALGPELIAAAVIIIGGVVAVITLAFLVGSLFLWFLGNG